MLGMSAGGGVEQGKSLSESMPFIQAMPDHSTNWSWNDQSACEMLMLGFSPCPKAPLHSILAMHLGIICLVFNWRVSALDAKMVFLPNSGLEFEYICISISRSMPRQAMASLIGYVLRLLQTLLRLRLRVDLVWRLPLGLYFECEHSSCVVMVSSEVRLGAYEETAFDLQPDLCESSLASFPHHSRMTIVVSARFPSSSIRIPVSITSLLPVARGQAASNVEGVDVRFL